MLWKILPPKSINDVNIPAITLSPCSQNWLHLIIDIMKPSNNNTEAIPIPITATKILPKAKKWIKNKWGSLLGPAKRLWWIVLTEVVIG